MKIFKIFSNEYIRSLIKINNFIIKLVCIALAVVLWAIVSSQNIESVDITVPVSAVNLSPEYAVVSMQKKTATVKVRGNKDLMKTVSRKMVTIEVDLKNPVIGKNQKYPLVLEKNEEYANLDFELKDDKIQITVEKKISKIVPVRVSAAGKGADNLIPVQFKTIPQFITVTGPESIVSNVPFVETETLPLNGKTAPVRQMLKLKMISGESISYDAVSVTVLVNLVSEDSIMRFSPKLIFRNQPVALEYNIINGAVTAFLRRDILPDSFNADLVEAVADFSLIDQRSLESLYNGQGEVSCPVKLHSLKYPAMELATLIPEFVPIRIFKKEK
jgi:hypothetical protein